MRLAGHQVLLCDCERSMRIDPERLAGALGAEPPRLHHQLCRAELKAFETALAQDNPFIVACTQECALFDEVAGEAGRGEAMRYVNIRERAGWSAEGADANPKIAALLAEAALPTRAARLKSIESDGSALVYGAGQAALDAATALAPHLSVTLVLSAADDLLLPSSLQVPVYAGRLRAVAGGFGGFEVTVDGYAPLLPSSRGGPRFAAPRNGARATCAVILDLSGGAPLVTGPDKRDGYHRVDPKEPAAVARELLAMVPEVGSFEKPIYVEYDADICAHSRSRIVGCNKCVDVCPAGAVTPAGDEVAFDAVICAGCGSCGAVCPTGAAGSAYPYRGDLIRRLQTLAATYRKAGGERPVLLLHGERHGNPLVAAMARYGRGLPVNVIPLALHAPTVAGHDTFAAALAAGFERVVLLLDPRQQDEHAGLQAEIALTEAFLAGIGLAAGRLMTLTENDPDTVEAALHDLPPLAGLTSSAFEPVGTKRDMARQALGKLLEQGRTEGPVPLPDGAPYGRIVVDTAGCTLCLACVSACPTNALLDNPERPQLRFVEAACVQCGLCRNTCPEKVISLEPRYDGSAAAMQPVTLNEEEPFQCIRCGKPFAAQSTIRRITERLAGRHWMFQTDDRSRLIQMCDDCRVQAQAEAGQGNPFAVGKPRRTVTTEDYLKAEADGLTIDDFLKDK